MSYGISASGGSGGSYFDNILWVIGEIEFLGFTSTAHDMQRAGWKFSSYKNPQHWSETVVAQHDRAGYLKCEITADWRDELRNHRNNSMGSIHIRMRAETLSREVYFNIHGPVSMNFVAKDMEPYETTMHEMNHVAFSWASPFRNLIVEEQKRIILPEEFNVSAMLEDILKHQQPGQQEYFKKVVQERERSTKVSAQIIQMVS